MKPTHMVLGGAMLALAAIGIQQTLATRAPSPGPHYASDQTREVVERMIQAHGGMARWQNAETISYDNIFFNPYAGAGNPWWYDREIIEQDSRRTFQDWSTDQATIAWDGSNAWSTNWERDNPPAFMVHFFYYFVNLPWLTQDAGVHLGPVERVQLPGSDLQFYAIDMTFEGPVSRVKSGADTYRLFIHPESWLLQAYQYSTGYAAMLEAMHIPEGEIFGPMYRWHDDFVTVDGLTFPSRMHTMPPDASETWGYHLLANYSLEQEFQASWMEMPTDAVVDHSPRDR
jgi:hypothetical protein